MAGEATADGATRSRRLRTLGGLLCAAAVALALGDDGGYSQGSRLRFAILAFAAAGVAVAADRGRARRFVRTPVLWVLVALGVLGAVSAAWTVGVRSEALHWGLTAAALAALLFATAVLVRDERTLRRAAAVLAVLAVGMAIVGLVAATETITPLAHRQAGRWRPASTFQYSPALALLAVSVLPALLGGMARLRGAWLSAAAALGGGIAAAVLALAESRTQLVFAVVVGVATISWAGPPRGRTAVAAALLFASGLVTYALAGGYIPVTPPPDGTARLLTVAAVVVGTALAWLAIRALLDRGVPVAAVAALLLAAGGAAALAKPAPRIIAAGIAQPERHPAKPSLRTPPAKRELHAIRDRLLHGRLRIWGDAIETFADRPLQGGGADAYLFASAPHQGPKSVLYAHDLPLELAAELGIGGLLLALALYGTSAVALWRSRAAPGAWLVWPAAAAFLCANLVDWPWHLAGSGAVWAFAFGALLGVSATRSGH